MQIQTIMTSSAWRCITVAAALLLCPAAAQTYSSCNPLQSTSCPADTALGMAIDVDFTQGGVNSFTSSGGSPTYGSDGVTFTVSKSGDAPQLTSVFYIMFGRVEVSLKAAPGAGIVSSFVLQSDDLDEIDWEWLGADSTEVQSNYFGKGITSSYNRGQFHEMGNNQDGFVTYVVDWTSDRVVWTIDGTVVRTLTSSDAESNQYPQTPMQVKFGAWSGGDSSNAQGTIEWARGPTDYSQGPFSMSVKSVKITDYSTGSSYSYGDTSGSWQSIKSNGGSINANLGDAGTLTSTAVASGATSSGTVPAGGIGGSTTQSASSNNLPEGWVMTSEGKIVPSSSATLRMLRLLPRGQDVELTRAQFRSRLSFRPCLHPLCHPRRSKILALKHFGIILVNIGSEVNLDSLFRMSIEPALSSISRCINSTLPCSTERQNEAVDGCLGWLEH
ncbi:concanavalin A-like lectin/glucanase domain-containing protein [Jackrogersella minutella]|nr:concanavalin A-like lectin/glucanase domain-containing protein [Jackrogersella minutella]